MPGARQSLAGGGPSRRTSSKMALHYVLAVLVAATVSFASQQPLPGNLPRYTPGWPCPIEFQIAPCICLQDTFYRLHMNCSLANSEEQLEIIFSMVFPFKDFYELKIIHDHNDVNNVIDKITPDTFADLSFERIIITGTRLTSITDEAFADSHKTLKHLDLSNNYLYAFTFESLPRYSVLRTFILDDNQFLKLFNLESASLEVFSANRNHKMAMSDKDQFTSVPRLRELYLSEIGLEVLQTGLFNKTTYLETVDFSKNHLTELEEGTIRLQEYTLKYVNFNDNEISEIRHDTFWGLRKDSLLTMARNKLVEVEEEHWKHIFQQIELRESIDLSGNNLLCGCDIDWLFMQYKEEYLCRLTDTSTCSSSEQVIFIDIDVFCTHCSDFIPQCPPPTDCKSPWGISNHW